MNPMTSYWDRKNLVVFNVNSGVGDNLFDFYGGSTALELPLSPHPLSLYGQGNAILINHLWYLILLDLYRMKASSGVWE